MASIRTASRYWSTLVLLVSIGLIGGFAYYVHQQVGLGQVLSLPLNRLSPLLAGFAALLSFLSLLWVLVLLEFRNTDEKHRDAAIKAELERLTAPGTEAAQHAAHIASDLRNQADALKASTTEAAQALDTTGTLFRQHSKDVADSAGKLTAAVNLIKDAIAAQTGDLISMSQNMGAQRASLVEAAKKETNALAEALNLSAQAIGSTVRGHGEQLSGLVGQASSQGASLQTAIKQQAEQLKSFADKQTADFAAAIDALSKRIEAATEIASARSDQMQAAVEAQSGLLTKFVFCGLDPVAGFARRFRDGDEQVGGSPARSAPPSSANRCSSRPTRSAPRSPAPSRSSARRWAISVRSRPPRPSRRRSGPRLWRRRCKARPRRCRPRPAWPSIICARR